MTETKSCERLRLYIYIYVYVYSSLIRNLSNDIFFRVYLATLPCIDQNLYSSLLNAPFSPKETEPVCLPRREKNRTFRTWMEMDILKKKKRKKKIQCGQESTYIFFTGWSSARFLNNASVNIDSWFYDRELIASLLYRSNKPWCVKKKKKKINRDKSATRCMHTCVRTTVQFYSPRRIFDCFLSTLLCHNPVHGSLNGKIVSRETFNHKFFSPSL